MTKLNVNQQHREGLSHQDKVGMTLGSLMGTMWAFYILLFVNFAWMFYETFLDPKPFDSYPFQFLLFCSNIIQLLWLPVLNVYQNVLNKHAELKADADYETDLKTQEDIKYLHEKIDRLINIINQNLEDNG